MIGGVGFHYSNPDLQEGWIGYVLRRDYWKQGIMTEAGHAIIKRALETFNLNGIFATCDESNIGSIGVLEKAGMLREKVIQNGRQIKGRWRNTCIYSKYY